MEFACPDAVVKAAWDDITATVHHAGASAPV
jgi:hypothetical protein